MKLKNPRPKSLYGKPFHYCPGCGHSLVHRLICEVVDELGIRDRTVGVAPVGCAVLAYDYWNFDVCEAAHGRTPAVATGLKRVCSDNIVFSYQGDGDLASIGMAETIHTANRGENITVIFINNAVYGMTGGQMAPTTLIGQKTTTTPEGRKPEGTGYPIRVCEMLATLEAPYYIERTAVISPKTVNATKRAIRKAFQYQVDKKGFTFVEILSPCPTNWGMSARESLEWIEKNMLPYFKTGVLRDHDGSGDGKR